MPKDPRLTALARYRLVPEVSRPELDALTALAHKIFDAPISAVTLLDEDTQWLVSRVGVDAVSTPRGHAFCDHTIRMGPHGLMVVEDATLDRRFADNPLVTGDLGIRFYAGAAITAPDGHNLGALCVIDRRPRERPSDAQLEILAGLAQQVMTCLRLHEAERRITQQRRLLGMAEALSSIGHWRLDLATDRVEWSEELYRIHGLDPGSTPPTRGAALSLYVEEDRARALGHIEALHATAGAHEALLRLRRPDGAIRHVMLRSISEHDHDGALAAIFGMVQDVTHEQEQHELFETAFQHAAVGIALVAPDGVFKQLNAAFCELVGYTDEELRATDFRAITHPDDLAADEAELARLVAGEISHYAMDKRYIHREGHAVWVRLSVALVRERDGRPRHFIAQVEDETARVLAQEALEQRTEDLVAMAADLEVARDAANAAAVAKAAFLANMSHELRTPLNAVVGFSQHLAASPTLPEEHQRSVQFIAEAGLSLNRLIDDVLDYSKLEAGAILLESEPFQLAHVIDDALALVETRALEKGLRLDVTGADPGLMVGDGFRLRQVLLNFLSNAVKFAAAGAVTVDVALGAGRHGRQAVRVTVIDQGVGIPAERLASLFQRFTQADSSISRTYGGTGLGLAISRELIELMGGTVGVDSREGEGSRFWFEVELPTVQLAAA